MFAWRSFEAYPIIAIGAGATPVQVPLTADERHDLDAMADAITDSLNDVVKESGNAGFDQSIATFYEVVGEGEDGGHKRAGDLVALGGSWGGGADPSIPELVSSGAREL